MTSYDTLNSNLTTGKVYRREMLLPYSRALDRDLAALTSRGMLEKLATGLYYKPKRSRLGRLPPNDHDLVKCFLNDSQFLIYSWNHYNTLGLGLTQVYNHTVVYNYKRHGLFKLGNRVFDFRRPARGFPNKLTPEFLLVDLLNNIKELAEDEDFVRAQVKTHLRKFDLKQLYKCITKYGKIATKRFFAEIGK